MIYSQTEGEMMAPFLLVLHGGLSGLLVLSGNKWWEALGHTQKGVVDGIRSRMTRDNQCFVVQALGT